MTNTPDQNQHVPQIPTAHSASAQQSDGQQSATSGGIVALICAGIALASAPLLMLIPYVGFLPAVIAGGGVLVGWRSLRHSTHRTGIGYTGLITAAVVFVLLAVIETVWNVFIAVPAVRDYQELQDVIAYIKDLIF